MTRSAVPAVGEHTDAILAELGLDAERIAACRQCHLMPFDEGSIAVQTARLSRGVSHRTVQPTTRRRVMTRDHTVAPASAA
jgi:hypothetical protein